MDGVLNGRLLLFDGASTIFRNIRLRPRSSSCAVCGDFPTITDLIDYEQFCQSGAHDKVSIWKFFSILKTSTPSFHTFYR